MWDWRRSHRSNNQEGLRRTKELHLLDHCCRQHLRHRPTADDGRARCLVMEHPLHRCDGCGFIFSIARIISSVTTWQDAASCCTHITTTYWGAIVGLSSPSLTTLRLSSSITTPRRRPAVRRQGRRRTGTSRGSTTSSARSLVSRIRHTPTTCRRVQSLQRSTDNAIQGRRIAAVTETRTVTNTYKGNNQRPGVTRVSTRQTSP